MTHLVDLTLSHCIYIPLRVGPWAEHMILEQSTECNLPVLQTLEWTQLAFLATIVFSLAPILMYAQNIQANLWRYQV